MNLTSLLKTTSRSKKRLGRGYGSGKGGHTSSRGQKGQNSRNSVPMWFEGGQLPLIRRLPFIRGKSRFVSLTPDAITISLAQLSLLKANSTVTIKSLIDAGIISAKQATNHPVKVVSTGSLTIPLTVALPTSETAKQRIEEAGGSVTRE